MIRILFLTYIYFCLKLIKRAIFLKDIFNSTITNYI